MKYRYLHILAFLIIGFLTLHGYAHDASCGEQSNQAQVEVITKPEGALPRDCRLGIFDFIHSTQIEGLGSDMAQQATQRLLQAKAFQSIELSDKEIVSLEHALSVGREQGYDLILVGEVKDFIHGGLSANSRVTLSIRIIDPQTNVTLWDLTGSMEDEPVGFLDFVLIWRESKEATSPYQLSSVLIEEMVRNITSPQEHQAGEDIAR